MPQQAVSAQLAITNVHTAQVIFIGSVHEVKQRLEADGLKYTKLPRYGNLEKTIWEVNKQGKQPKVVQTQERRAIPWFSAGQHLWIDIATPRHHERVREQEARGTVRLADENNT